MSEELKPIPDEVFSDEFAAWWESDGKYVRAGGGEYERSFAFEAFRHLMPHIVQLRALLAQSESKGVKP